MRSKNTFKVRTHKKQSKRNHKKRVILQNRGKGANDKNRREYTFWERKCKAIKKQWVMKRFLLAAH